ncbi:MAG: hypothetical protein LBF22_11140 [Deltaproteobacteria bacterium]|jgi:hypothetical protein|nr:hypothetical protein [Deltaproteobacteria bacterium]
MKLAKNDVDLFYKLMMNLFWSVNDKHKINTELVRKDKDGPPQINAMLTLTVREPLWNHREWIEEYLKETGKDTLTEEEYKIVESWGKYTIMDTFFCVKHLAKYSVLLREEKGQGAKLYGVSGITDSFEDTFSIMPLPFMATFVLLPFKDRIIYDGIVKMNPNVVFGPGISAQLNNTYNKTKAKSGIIERLDTTVDSSSKKKVKQMPRT